MEQRSIPKPGEIYLHFKDKLYQIITVATHTETQELMVVYQALYGDFKTYVRPLAMFLSEVDREKYPEVKQKYRFELRRTQEGEPVIEHAEIGKRPDQKIPDEANKTSETKRNGSVQNNNGIPFDKIKQSEAERKDEYPEELQNAVPSKDEAGLNRNPPQETVSELLLDFLDAKTYSKKLEILTSNTKHLNDRMINDMAVSLDCTVEEGPIEQRIQGLVQCLQAMRRFEDRRLR